MNIDRIDYELSERSRNALKREGVESVEALLALSLEELRAIPGLGDKSVAEISWLCVQLTKGEKLQKIIEFERDVAAAQVARIMVKLDEFREWISRR